MICKENVKNNKKIQKKWWLVTLVTFWTEEDWDLKPWTKGCEIHELQWNRAALDVIHHGLIVQILQDPEMQASYSMWEWKLWNSEIWNDQ